MVQCGAARVDARCATEQEGAMRALAGGVSCGSVVARGTVGLGEQAHHSPAQSQLARICRRLHRQTYALGCKPVCA